MRLWVSERRCLSEVGGREMFARLVCSEQSFEVCISLEKIYFH